MRRERRARRPRPRLLPAKKRRLRKARRKRPPRKSEAYFSRSQFQRFQVAAESLAEFLVLQGDFHGGFQKTEFFAGIVGRSLVNVSQQSLLFGQDFHGVGELNLPSRSRFGAFQAAKD